MKLALAMFTPVAVLLGSLLFVDGGVAAVPTPALDASWFQSSRWDDGAADVTVFHGRVHKYGTWHEAEARDWVIREYMDPVELTKRDGPGAGRLPVLKMNRMVRFDTGPYDYRLMTSLFFERGTGALVKGVGASQEACGLTTQRWDRASGRLAYDSYWEGEGRGEEAGVRQGLAVFRDELPLLAGRIEAGERILVLPSLASGRVKRPSESARAVTVSRLGATTRLVDDGGREYAAFTYDLFGVLQHWIIHGEEEFQRSSHAHEYYWLRMDHCEECNATGTR